MGEGSHGCVDPGRLERLNGMIERLVAELVTIDLDAASAKRIEALTRHTLGEIGDVVGAGWCTDDAIDELREIEAELLAWLRVAARADVVIDLRHRSPATATDPA